jgi:hypothetical protein
MASNPYFLRTTSSALATNAGGLTQIRCREFSPALDRMPTVGYVWRFSNRLQRISISGAVKSRREAEVGDGFLTLP